MAGNTVINHTDVANTGAPPETEPPGAEPAMKQLEVPNLNIERVTADSVDLSWGPIADAKEYIVAKSTDGGNSWEPTKDITGGTPKITVSDLKANMTYHFRIKATAPGYDASAWSKGVSATTALAMPTLNAGDVMANSVALSWDPIAEAKVYLVSKSTDGGNSWAPAVEVTGDLPKTTVPDLKVGIPYCFRIKATATGYTESIWSEKISVTLVLPTPRFTPHQARAKKDVAKGNYVVLSWDEITGATGYRVQYRIAGSESWSLDNADNVKVLREAANVIKLNPDTKYEFRVRATNGGGDSDWSETETVGTLPSPPSTPTGLKSTDKDANSVSLEWDSVDDAISYKVQYKGGGAWSSDIIVSGTETTVSELAPGTKYEFRIRATNKGGDSDWSDCESETTRAPRGCVVILGIGVAVLFIVSIVVICGLFMDVLNKESDTSQQNQHKTSNNEN